MNECADLISQLHNRTGDALARIALTAATEIERLMGERDEWKRKWSNNCTMHSSAAEHRDRLLIALRRFGQHDITCDITQGAAICSCGFTLAFA